MGIETEIALLEITNKCNFNCSFCYVGANSNGKFMSWGEFVFIVDELKKIGIKKVAISGGEPLLHKDIKNILQYLHEQGLIVKLLTNGYLLDDEVISFFQRNQEHYLQISLDGVNEETNSLYRGKGGFEIVLRIAKELGQTGYKNGILRMTITKYNYHQVVRFYKMCEKVKFNADFSIVQNIGKAYINWNDLKLSQNQYSFVLEEIRKLAEVDHKMIQQICNILPIRKCPLLSDKPSFKLRVDCFGNVYPCHVLGEIEYCMGNIFETSLRSILDLGYEDLKKRIVQKILKLSEYRCSKCFVSKMNFCKGACIHTFLELEDEQISEECSKIRFSLLTETNKHNLCF